MYDIKPQIIEALESIPDANVSLIYPEDFNVLPVISFYELDNSEIFNGTDIPEMSDIKIQIDVYGKTTAEVDSLSIAIADKMKALGFKRPFAGDVPDAKYKHKTMRFEAQIDFNEFVYQG